MPYARDAFYPTDKSKTMYRRWAAIGAAELVRVAEAQTREGHADLARNWIIFAVRSLALSSAFETTQLFDAARGFELAVEICGEVRASSALMANDSFQLSLVKDSFMRTLRAAWNDRSCFLSEPRLEFTENRSCRSW